MIGTGNGVEFRDCKFVQKRKRRRYLKLRELEIDYDDIVSISLTELTTPVTSHGRPTLYMVDGYDITIVTKAMTLYFPSTKVPAEIVKWNKYMTRRKR